MNSASITQRIERLRRWALRPGSAALLMALLLAVITVGSFFPQLVPEPTRDAQATTELKQALQQRYGSGSSLLQAVGLFWFARSPLYLLLLLALVTATVICTAARVMPLWRRAWDRQVYHAAAPWARVTAERQVMYAAAPQLLQDQISRLLQHRRYRLRQSETDDGQWLRGDRRRLSALGSVATHVGLLLLLMGALFSALWSWRQDLSLAPGERVVIERVADLALRHDGFAIDRDPDGSPSGYRAWVTAWTEGRETHELIRINHPLRLRGTGVYLSSYWGTPGDEGIVLLLSHDPGYLPVLLGGLLLTLGMAVSLYWPTRTMRVHIKQGDQGDTLVRMGLWSGRRPLVAQRELDELLQLLEIDETKVGEPTPPRKGQAAS